MKKVRVKKLRPGYAQGYNKQAANGGRFVITDHQLKKMKQAKEVKK